MPYERKNAVLYTEQFLKDLRDPKKYPRVPKIVRQDAQRLLRHYPSTYDMEQAGEQAPDVFGEWNPER